MSVGPGYIPPDAVSRIETLLDQQAGPNEPEENPDTQRTDPDEANPPLGVEETPPEETGEPTPQGDPPEGEEPLVAEGEKSEEGDPKPKIGDGESDITTLAGLAQEFEVDEEVLLSEITVGNGLGYELPLGEALTSWREQSTNLLKRQEAQESEFQTKMVEINSHADEELKQLGALASVLVAEMDSDLKVAGNLEDFKAADPTGYVDFIEKRHRRQKLIADAVQRFDLSSTDRQNQADGDIDRVKQREATQLAQKMPHWRKPEVAKQVVEENTALMTRLGYSAEEQAAVIDHRHILILHYAAQHLKTLEQAQGKTLENLRKKQGLRRPGMVRRATARVDQGEPEVIQRRERLGHLRKNATTESAAALIATYMK